MPGLLKIGFTNKPIEQRIDQLDSATGVPMPFELEFCVRVENAQDMERRLHAALHEFRVSNQKEFFKLVNEEAIKQILSVLTSAESASIAETEIVQASDNTALTDARRRRANRVFSDDETIEIISKRTFHGREPNADSGSHLNDLWKMGAKQALFRKTGDFYMPLKKFPGALCDSNGYVLFETEATYKNCHFLSIGRRVSVSKGISSIPNYKRMR